MLGSSVAHSLPDAHCSWCPAANKLHTELTSTQAELTSAKAAKAAAEEALVVESEALRLKLGGMKQQMANNAAELEKQTQTAEDMKSRVAKLNTSFTQTSEHCAWLVCWATCLVAV